MGMSQIEHAQGAYRLPGSANEELHEIRATVICFCDQHLTYGIGGESHSGDDTTSTADCRVYLVHELRLASHNTQR